MSMTQTVLAIVFFINLFIFLAGKPEVDAPMLGMMQAVVTGNYNFDWTQFFTLAKLLQIGAIAGLVLIVSQMLSPGAGVVTSNFATFHAMSVIGLAAFITFLAVPNFGNMGFPSPLDFVINVIFGFMTTAAILGYFGKD